MDRNQTSSYLSGQHLLTYILPQLPPQPKPRWFPRHTSPWLSQAAEENQRAFIASYAALLGGPRALYLVWGCIFYFPSVIKKSFSSSHQQTLQLLQHSVEGWQESSSNEMTWSQC